MDEGRAQSSPLAPRTINDAGNYANNVDGQSQLRAAGPKERLNVPAVDGAS